MRRGKTRATASFALLALVMASFSGCGARPAPSAGAGPRPVSPAPTTISVPTEIPPGGRGLLGAVLSGVGTHLKPPLNPSSQPYGADCHQLVDPGFSGSCTVASSPEGTVAGVVEVESAASSRLRQRLPSGNEM